MVHHFYLVWCQLVQELLSNLLWSIVQQWCLPFDWFCQQCSLGAYTASTLKVLQHLLCQYLLCYFVNSSTSAFEIQVLSMSTIKWWGNFRIFHFALAICQQKNCQRPNRSQKGWHKKVKTIYWNISFNKRFYILQIQM